MGAEELLQLLGIPSGIVGIGLPLLLWLRGTIMLTSNHEAAMATAAATHAAATATARAACDAELQAVRSDAGSKVAAAEALAAARQDRIEHLVVDRDAWRDAQREEAAARAASERAAAALMEQGQIVLALLSALKEALARGPEGR